MSTSYQKLDYLIVQAIKNGADCFHRIQHNKSGAWEEAGRIALATSRPQFRIIDARLQALRKRGLIKHLKGLGWTAVEAK